MEKKELYAKIDSQYDRIRDMARKIWEYAETAHTESKSSALQKDYLAERGFAIREVPNMPTAFIAEYGSGFPIIGFLGEYDALPGMSQKVQTTKEPVVESGNGHACGHNLIGTGCVSAVEALKAWMQEENIAGTIRYYGCPAEETLMGKPLMAKEGVFDDLDIVLSWHPSLMNKAVNFSSLASTTIRFQFKGIPAHAAMSPELGRSALDAVEIMNIGANYLREHIPDSARIHYMITNGGQALNVIPEFAEVMYMVRARKHSQAQEIIERLYKVAQGAALITETEVTHEVTAGCYDMIINRDLCNLVQANLEEVGGPQFTEEDLAFAQEMSKDFTHEAKKGCMGLYFVPEEEITDSPLMTQVVKPDAWGQYLPGSFDHGDVSNLAPFSYLFLTAFPVGTATHAWQMTACAGSEMGMKSLPCCAKVLAGTAYDLLTNHDLVYAAKATFEKDMNGKKYAPQFN